MQATWLIYKRPAHAVRTKLIVMFNYHKGICLGQTAGISALVFKV